MIKGRHVYTWVSPKGPKVEPGVMYVDADGNPHVPDRWSRCYAEVIHNWIIVEDINEPPAEYTTEQVPAGTKAVEVNGRTVNVPDPDHPAVTRRVLVKPGYEGLSLVDAVPDVLVQMRYDFHWPNPNSVMFVYHDAQEDTYEQWHVKVGQDGEFSNVYRITPVEKDFFLKQKASFKREVDPARVDEPYEGGGSTSTRGIADRQAKLVGAR